MNRDLSIYDITLVIIVGTMIVILFAYFIVMFFFTYKQKYKAHEEEVTKIKHEFAQTLLQSQLEIKEQTLSQISHELHDNLGQVASLIKINLYTIPLNDKVKAEEKVEFTKELIRQLIGDLKALSASLSSDRIQQLGLPRALELEVQRLNKTGQFKADYKGPDDMPFIDLNKTIILYRMVQEVLNNMVKHSGAKHISVSFTANENLIKLAISDDGVGFNVEEKTKSNQGAGLMNLQNRSRLINAQLNTRSSPGSGTLVTIELAV